MPKPDPAPHRRRFPRAARLTRTSEFSRVKAGAQSWNGKFMVLNVLHEPDAAEARLGFITSRRVGGAVERNKLRRRLREVVRVSRPRLKAGCWLVIIGRRNGVEAAFAEIANEFEKLALRAGVLEPDKG